MLSVIAFFDNVTQSTAKPREINVKIEVGSTAFAVGNGSLKSNSNEYI